MINQNSIFLCVYYNYALQNIRLKRSERIQICWEETPLKAAKRELYEESGAVDFEIESLCDYRAWNEETGHGANGVVFHAVIRRFDAIPESEMAEIKEFTSLPDNLTYPAITSVVFEYLFNTRK